MAKPVKAVSYTIGVGATAGGIASLNEVAILFGVVFTAVTFLVNWRYQAKRHELALQKRKEEAEYHAARMVSLMGEKGNDCKKKRGA